MVAWKHNPPPKQNPTPEEYVNPEGFGVDPPMTADYVRPLVKQSNVLPYRGQEYHGVNPNLAGEPPDINNNVFDQTGVVPAGQQAPERANIPVPVRIVKGQDEWEQQLFRTTGVLLSGAPITVVGHMRTRTNLIITNNGAVAILLSSEQQPMQPNSVQVPAGGSFTTNGQNRIYGVTVDNSPQPVSVLEEYTITAQRKPTY